jgi:hypothetical protein
LIIESRRGQFTAEDVDAQSSCPIGLVDPPSTVTLACDVPVGYFCVRRDKSVEYWVAPLVNCLVKCSEPTATLGQHPLRPVDVQSSPNRPDLPDLAGLRTTGSSLSDIITFDVGGPAFLVATHDYEYMRLQLRAARDKSRITALMVGHVAGRGVAVSDLQEWFPLDLVEWLSVASGTRVRIPWLEFRDANGLLVSRMHFPRYHSPHYEAGRNTIDEPIHRGYGRMLTLAVRSQHFRAAPLRVALRAIQAVQRLEVNRDDAMLRLLLALEGLTTMLGAQRVPPSSWASPETDVAAEAIVRGAASGLEALGTKLRKEEKIDEAQMISRVQSAVRRQYPPLLGAGRAIVNMLSQLGLHDVEAIDPFLSAHRWLGEKSLARLLDQCRGRLAHHGYLADAGEGPSPRQAFNLLLYLQDLTLRVVLRIIGYDGLYDPPVLRFRGSESVDWVKAGTAPDLLGFD